MVSVVPRYTNQLNKKLSDKFHIDQYYMSKPDSVIVRSPTKTTIKRIKHVGNQLRPKEPTMLPVGRATQPSVAGPRY